MSGLLDSKKVTVNLALFNKMYFYRLFDPSSKKIFNCNVYQLILVFINFMVACFLISGHLGYFIDREFTTDNIVILQIIFVNIINVLSLLKTIIFVYKAKDIWNLFNVTRVNFLASKQCHNYIDVHKNYGDISTKLTYLLSFMGFAGAFVWGLYPLVMYAISNGDMNEENTTNLRIENIMNLPFPVTAVYTYNNYFIFFYILELSNLIFNVFIHAVYDIFIVTFSFALIAQYEIITKAFEKMGYTEQITVYAQDDYSKSVN